MKNLRKLLATVLALLMIMSFVPCFAQTVPSADGITLSRTSSYITVGMTVQLTADADVTWSTSNNAVATVSESGLVTAVAVGKTDITATTSDGKTAVCKVDVYDIEIRNHVSTPTPDVDGGQFLTDLFDAEKFKVMLTFDDNADDVTGNINTTVKDNLTYENGFNGKAANFKNGYVELTDAVLGKDSITISTWVKTTSIVSDPPDYLISTCPHNPQKNINDGFYIGLRSGTVDLFYNRKPAEDITNGTRQTASVNVGTDTPADIYDGWVNLTWVVNKTNKRLLVYVDYELVKNIGINVAMKYDGEWAPMLGRGVYIGGKTINYDGLMDDFFIYDGAMTTDELQKLKNYYKLVRAIPTEGVSISKDSLSLSINEAANLTANVTPSNATTPNIIWTTSDVSVATVNNGRVRGIGAGTATITATTVDGGFVDSCEVTVSENVEPFQYDRVCFIGVDGGGAWINDDFMPNVQRIFKDAASTETCKVALPSISAQGWSCMTHGVLPGYHKNTNYTIVKRNFPEDSPYPSFYRVLHEAEPDAEMAIFPAAASHIGGIVEENSGVTFVVSNSYDEVQTNAVKYLQEHDPKIIFIHYGFTDATGHKYGYGPEFPEYVEQMGVADNNIREIYEIYEEKGWLDSTLFILTADHGGINTSHGGSTPEETNVYMGILGPGVKKNSEIVDAESRDVAAIVAHALGLERPAGWTAKVPDGVFEGVFGDVRNEVPYPTSEYRNHINTDAPTEEGARLTDILGEENFEFLLDFDDENANDVTGNHKTTINKTLTYKEGYFGKAANFSGGSVSVDEIEFGTESFTFGAWMKTDGFKNRCVLVSSKEILVEGNGFYVTPGEMFTTMAMRDDSHRISFSDVYYPLDMTEGWTHVMYVYNAEEGYVECYMDFTLADGLNGGSFTLPTSGVTIGSDVDGNYAYPLTATLDDVFMYNGAMTAEQIAKLSQYYSKEGTELSVTDVVFSDSVSFDYDVAGDIADSSIYAAIYDSSMKLIDVKKFDTASAGGESIQNAAGAKYLKVFILGDDLMPKCVHAEAIKE